MKTFKDGGPAFPVTTDHGSVYPISGMTLRDYFAAAALQGMLSDPNNCTALPETAMYAYRSADAMLIERAKTKETQS